ncbi:MAG: tetratricopeptide repeat protein [Bacteroidota bacterium]|nr:tetratricopeptide repeat protein [Bacteroidota bacterium]
MAKVKILQCSGCGANLSPDNNRCEYCGSVNLITAEVNPFKLEPELKNKYSSYYREKATADPKDVSALYSVGLFYLELKNYELAVKNFSEAISQSPDNPDVYYYYAIALNGGKKPRKLMIKDVKKIEEYLDTALRLEKQAKTLYLLALIKEDFYNGNCLKMAGQDPLSLISEAHTLPVSDDEISFMLKHVVIKDENILSLINKN